MLLDLFDHQKNVVDEAIKSPNKAIILPMGFGKTIIGLALAIKRFQETQTPSLVICSKTLLVSWISEIRKFSTSTTKIKYEVCHREHLGGAIDSWRPRPETQLVLTTPEVAVMSYIQGMVQEQFIFNVDDRIIEYRLTTNPWSRIHQGVGVLHSTTWASVLIDEAQNYNNCETKRCRAIASLATNVRWLLSGTLFQEPPVRRFLGFFLLLGQQEPRNLSACSLFIRNEQFTGFRSYCIERSDNPVFKGVECQTKIVAHDMSGEEKLCYSLLVKIMQDLCHQYNIARINTDRIETRRIRGCILAMWTYLRQALVSPLLPVSQLLTKIQKDDSDERSSDYISNACQKVFHTHNLTEWLHSEDAGNSSRLKQVKQLVKKHPKNKIIIFGSFVTSLKLTKEFLGDQILTYILHGEMSTSQRQQVLHQFAQSDQAAILFLTYQIGSEGLNLQFANVVIHLDLYWNSGKEDQAVARVFRYGQVNPIVHQYILISPTYLEKVMLEKQKGKVDIIQQLRQGPLTISTKVATLSIKEMQQIIKGEDVTCLANLYRTPEGRKTIT